MSGLVLRARDRELSLGGRPLLMGILNATPDSFSDGGAYTDLGARAERAAQLVADGADIVDIGGESNVTNRPAVAWPEEIERVVPLVEQVARLDVTVSVDTYKPEVAEAAIAAGAHLVNDISGLADPRLAAVCAGTGAGLVLMHTPVRPKTQSFDESRYGDVAAEVAGALADLMARAQEHGVAAEQLLLDPGPDFGKTPAQTVAALRGLPALHALGRPLLLALSRKDFIGAIIERRPRERDPGTLAAIGYAADRGAHVFRVHDVRGVADYLAVRAVLQGDEELAPEARVPEAVRREPPPVQPDR
jgi:dihydropteroate synthase